MMSKYIDVYVISVVFSLNMHMILIKEYTFSFK